MKEFNPYAAPAADLSPRRAPDGDGVWRDGNLLVMSKDAELPDRCLKCNEPAVGYTLKRSLMWHSPGWFVLIISPILYIIVAMIVRKTATVHAPLCPLHRRRRRNSIALACGLCLLGAAMIAVGLSAADALGPENRNVPVASCIAGLLAFLVGLMIGVRVSQLVTPRRIDKRYVWLQKVHPDFLAQLPPFQTWRTAEGLSFVGINGKNKVIRGFLGQASFDYFGAV